MTPLISATSTHWSWSRNLCLCRRPRTRCGWRPSTWLMTSTSRTTRGRVAMTISTLRRWKMWCQRRTLCAPNKPSRGSPGQGWVYRIENLSNADISDFFVYRRVYRIEPPISSISICPRYAFILSFSAENSPKNPKILWKFRKFSGNSENSPKIQKIRRNFWKFAENSENSPKIH